MIFRSTDKRILNFGEFHADYYRMFEINSQLTSRLSFPVDLQKIENNTKLGMQKANS